MLFSLESKNGQLLLQAMTPNQQKLTTENLWRELSDRLRQFVATRIKSSADVDDVLQTIFLRIHSKSSELRNPNRIESWVFQLTRNAVADYFRKARDTVHDVELLADQRLVSEPEKLNTELVVCLNVFLNRLPSDQRRAVSLYELDGMSQKDIAAKESMSLSGAKSRIQRGRKSLAAMLKSCCTFQLDDRGNVLDYRPVDAHCCDNQC